MPFKRKERAFEIIAAFKMLDHAPKKVLDMGFGDAEITRVLHNKGYDIKGLGVSKEQSEKALAKYPDMVFETYDGLHIPFDDNTFDTVILNDVVEHIPYSQIEILIEEIKRVVEPGGIIYASVTNRYEIIEPHTFIPFLTWLPRIFWKSIERSLNKRGSYPITAVYPYTFKRLKRFCKRHDLKYHDLTTIYTSHKFMDVNYIGSRWLRSIVKLLKRLKLLKLFYYAAYQLSVIIFVLRIPE